MPCNHSMIVHLTPASLQDLSTAQTDNGHRKPSARIIAPLHAVHPDQQYDETIVTMTLLPITTTQNTT